MALKKLYTAKATAVGGRDGNVKTDDGVIDIALSMPKSLGGAGKENATNPEQLFAAGYSACFDSALNLVIRNQKVKTGTTTVEADVHLGQDETGFGLAVDLKVNIPDVDLETAQALANAAHSVCPYSKATKGNIEVTVTATNNSIA